MKKYRIVAITKGGTTWYNVQVRWWILGIIPFWIYKNGYKGLSQRSTFHNEELARFYIEELQFSESLSKEPITKKYINYP